MGDLTPFQNQVLDAAEAWETRKQEEKREEMREQSGQGGQTRNSRAPASSGSGSSDDPERVRYVNKQELPDHEVHQDD